MSRYIRATVPVLSAASPRPNNPVCITVERWFLSLLIGYASTLLQDNFWEGSQAEIDAAAAAVRTQLLALLGEGDCVSFDPEFRLNECHLEWRAHDADAWIDLGNVCGADGVDGVDGADADLSMLDFQITGCDLEWRLLDTEPYANLGNVCGADGAPGADGADGADGRDGSDGTAGAPDPGARTDGDPDVRRCNAAWYLTNWLFDTYSDTIDQVEAAADTAAALDAFLAIFPPFYFVWDEISDLINEIAEAGVAIARTWDSVANREQEAEKIYCLLNADGVLTDAAWNVYLDEYDGIILDPAKSCYANFVVHISAGTAVSRANIGTYYETEVCPAFSCVDEWCYLFDFLVSDGGWQQVVGGSNTWLSGTGWIGEAAPNADRNFITLNMPATAYVKTVQFVLDHNDGVDAYAWVCPGANDISCNYDWDNTTLTIFTKGVEQSINKVALGVEQSQNSFPVGNIIQVIMRGTGENPFGEDNC